MLSLLVVRCCVLRIVWCSFVCLSVSLLLVVSDLLFVHCVLLFGVRLFVVCCLLFLFFVDE